LLQKNRVWHADSQQEQDVNLMDSSQILPVWMKTKWLTVNAVSAKYEPKSANVFCGKTSVERLNKFIYVKQNVMVVKKLGSFALITDCVGCGKVSNFIGALWYVVNS
jgi:hypothetical protein